MWQKAAHELGPSLAEAECMRVRVAGDEFRKAAGPVTHPSALAFTGVRWEGSKGYSVAWILIGLRC